MKNESMFLANSLWNCLCLFLKDIGCFPEGRSALHHPEYRRLVYDKGHGLLTFEVEHNTFPGLTERLLSTKKAHDLASVYFHNQKIDFVDLGAKVYFYFWIKGLEEDQYSEFSSLVKV